MHALRRDHGKQTLSISPASLAQPALHTDLASVARVSLPSSCSTRCTIGNSVQLQCTKKAGAMADPNSLAEVFDPLVGVVRRRSTRCRRCRFEETARKGPQIGVDFSKRKRRYSARLQAQSDDFGRTATGKRQDLNTRLAEGIRARERSVRFEPGVRQNGYDFRDPRDMPVYDR